MTIHKFEGDVSTGTAVISITLGSDPSILSMNIGPTALNAASSIAIDSSTTKYTIQESTGDSLLYTINIAPEDTRFPDYYRIFYVGDYGETEAFNFDLVPTNTIQISKTSFVNDRIKRSFGTTVNDNYMVTSNWICENTSQSLKELWSSPLTNLYKDGLYIPILLNETSKTIYNRHNVKPINYTLSFTYAEEYTIQSQ